MDLEAGEFPNDDLVNAGLTGRTARLHAFEWRLNSSCIDYTR
jgi:hypothetical protein